MAPFSIDLFKGMLAFFLLDMGLPTARNLSNLRGQSRWLLAYAALAPLVHASLALGLAPGNTALRYAIPEANPSVYFSMSLGITSPRAP